MSIREDIEWQEYVQSKIVVPKFYRKVWPGSKIIESDKLKESVAQILDLFGGTDKVLIFKGIPYSIAQRIQRKEFAYKKTITLRYKRSVGDKEFRTELQKLIEAIKNEGIRSTYLSHCYANGSNKENTTDLMRGIIVKTTGLINLYLDKPQVFGYSWTVKDGLSKDGLQKREDFKYITFKDIRKYAPEIIEAYYDHGLVLKPSSLYDFLDS